MVCECCSKDHGGDYGSGRFCGVSCARSYSTKAKRQEINKKVSQTLRSKTDLKPANGFKKGYDPRRCPFDRLNWKKGIQTVKNNRDKFYKIADWDELPIAERYRRVLKRQDSKCLHCGIDTWLGKPIVLEIHHIDGTNPKNDSSDNLCYLCPNCHSQTDNFRAKNIKAGVVERYTRQS